MKRRIFWGAFKYGVGFLLLGWVVWSNWTGKDGQPGLSDILQRPLQVGPFILASVLCLAAVLITFLRWYLLVRAQELPFTVSNAMRLGLVGFFLSTFMPGSIGGDIIKAYCIAREQKRRTVAVATVLIDRGIGLWGLIILAALLGSIFWMSGNSAIIDEPTKKIMGFEVYPLKAIICVTVGLVIFTSLLWCTLIILPAYRAERFAGRLSRIPKIGHAASEFWRAVWMYRLKYKTVAISLGMSLVAQVGFVLTFYFSAQTFQDPAHPDQIPSLAEHFLIVPIGMTFQALFPTPGGLGGAELGFSGLYAMTAKVGQDARTLARGGLAASLAYRLITWMLAFVGYLVYLRMKPQIAESMHMAEVAAESEAAASEPEPPLPDSPAPGAISPVTE